MADAQDIRIKLLKSLTQLVSWWCLKVWRKWVAIGHRRGEKGEKGGDVLRCSIYFSHEARKVLEPGRLVGRSRRVMGELVGGVGDET